MTLRQLVYTDSQSSHIFTDLTFLQVYYGRSMNDERLMRVRAGTSMKICVLNVRTIQSANYVRTELPVRISHRLRDLQALPYIVVTQEGVARVHEVRVSEPHCFAIHIQLFVC